MKKFNQTPYKLPPPTPIHVPAEKRPLEEKALPKKRVRITPVMRRVSRRSERPMTPVQIPQPPVQIPDVLEPVQIPDVPQPVQIWHTCPQSPVQIPDVLEPVQIPDVPQSPVQIPVSHVPQSHVQIPLVHIPDVPEPVQIPVSQVPEPPVQILVPQSPVQIPVSHSIPCSTTCADSCADSKATTCADSHVQNLCRFQCHTSHSHLCRFYMYQNLCRFQCHTSHSHLCSFYMSEPVQIPVSHVPQSPVQSLPEPMQLFPELDMLDPLESTDAFDQLMSFVFGPQELQLLHTVPSIFDENLFSFLDEREPMDLTMPRLNSCVKNIAFKPIQLMDLSVNSSIGQ
ncbi:hypothetical protein TNCV_4889611 [Trichonephila clavipes]|nr:hypothetical protein TNCV_4889611 [Trichonephila clavipes]